MCFWRETMNLSELQHQKKRFDEDRNWNSFPASQVFVHLVEEIGEIGRSVLYKEGYKKEGLGHSEAPSQVQREYAQSLSLLIQLANIHGVDLEEAYHEEMRIMRRRFPAKAWRDYVKRLKP